jgi:hypothetical protein
MIPDPETTPLRRRMANICLFGFLATTALTLVFFVTVVRP